MTNQDNNPLSALDGQIFDYEEVDQGVESQVAYDDGHDFTATQQPSGVDHPATDRQLRSVLSKAEAELQVPGALQKLDDQATRQAAREALKELYGDEFEVHNAPNDIDRLEKTLAIHELAWGITSCANNAVDDKYAEPTRNHPEIEHAVLLIEEMQSYGALAERHLAALNRDQEMPLPIRRAATDALSEVRENQNEDKTLMSVIKSWLKQGGDS